MTPNRALRRPEQAPPEPVSRRASKRLRVELEIGLAFLLDPKAARPAHRPGHRLLEKMKCCMTGFARAPGRAPCGSPRRAGLAIEIEPGDRGLRMSDPKQIDTAPSGSIGATRPGPAEPGEQHHAIDCELGLFVRDHQIGSLWLVPSRSTRANSELSRTWSGAAARPEASGQLADRAATNGTTMVETPILISRPPAWTRASPSQASRRTRSLRSPRLRPPAGPLGAWLAGEEPLSGTWFGRPGPRLVGAGRGRIREGSRAAAPLQARIEYGRRRKSDRSSQAQITARRLRSWPKARISTPTTV